MNCIPIIPCPHHRMKEYSPSYDRCINCNTLVCRHPSKFTIKNPPNHNYLELIQKMRYKAGLFTTYYCRLCKQDFYPNGVYYNTI